MSRSLCEPGFWPSLFGRRDGTATHRNRTTEVACSSHFSVSDWIQFCKQGLFHGLISQSLSSHSTVTAVIDIPIAIPENEDRIGSARSMHLIETDQTISTLSSLFCR